MNKINISAVEFEKAKKLIPGGVNSPVRSFKSVGGIPRFIKKACGSRIVDMDDNVYTDYCMSWGALLFGHSRREIINSIIKQARNGTSYGAATSNEVEIARLINSSIPSMEKIRFVNSGTEAVMSAVRLARGFTKRDGVVKFEGCYHGHSDSMLISAGSGVSEVQRASSSGITKNTVADTYSLPFNNIEIFKSYISRNWRKIACVVVEPVPANMGVIIPKPSFLETLRKETARYGIILIFDEVITGFRINDSTAQNYFDIKPDITCLGKIIGGGFPVACFGGSRDIMDKLSPLGDVYQAGTLSGNPVAIRAGIETLLLIKKEKPHRKTNELMKILKESINFDGVSFSSFGSMFTLFFNQKSPENFEEVNKSDRNKFARFFHFMLEKGIYLSPSQLEADFLSYAHSQRDMEIFIKNSNEFFKKY
jgi:glutamate-1-semialdehyde 2,1-aminomutase